MFCHLRRAFTALWITLGLTLVGARGGIGTGLGFWVRLGLVVAMEAKGVES